MMKVSIAFGHGRYGKIRKCAERGSKIRLSCAIEILQIGNQSLQRLFHRLDVDAALQFHMLEGNIKSYHRHDFFTVQSGSRKFLAIGHKPFVNQSRRLTIDWFVFGGNRERMIQDASL